MQEEMDWTLLPIASCSGNVLTQYFSSMEFHYVTRSRLYRKFMQNFPDSSHAGLMGGVWAQDCYTLWCVYYWIEKLCLIFTQSFITHSVAEEVADTVVDVAVPLWLHLVLISYNLSTTWFSQGDRVFTLLWSFHKTWSIVNVWLCAYGCVCMCANIPRWLVVCSWGKVNVRVATTDTQCFAEYINPYPPPSLNNEALPSVRKSLLYWHCLPLVHQMECTCGATLEPVILQLVLVISSCVSHIFLVKASKDRT